MDAQITPAQFWLQYGYKPYELVDGVVIRRPKLRLVESVVLLRVSALIEQYAAENDLGEVVSGVGFRLNANTIRSPRAAFIAKSVWEGVRHPYSPFPFAPSLTIEIAPDAETPADPYLAADTSHVWFLHIQSQQVTVQRPHSPPQVYNLGETLTGEQILPGLVLPVASLFPKSRHF